MVTNRNPESDYGVPYKAIRRVVEHYLEDFNTALPGIVQSFDRATRRARVSPALSIVSRAGTFDRADIFNVPVVMPHFNGYTIMGELLEGDPVLLVFSQRGIANFKDTHGKSIPTPEGGFAEHDAIAIPGFGPMSITPAADTGLLLQANDGSHYIRLNNGAIEIFTTGGTITLTGNTQITGRVDVTGSLFVNGRAVELV